MSNKTIRKMKKEKSVTKKKRQEPVAQSLQLMIRTEGGNLIPVQGHEFTSRSTSEYFAKADAEALIKRSKERNKWLKELNLEVAITPIL